MERERREAEKETGPQKIKKAKFGHKQFLKKVKYFGFS
jgi:hypothetical protein